jgi:hypothetical protein
MGHNQVWVQNSIAKQLETWWNLRQGHPMRKFDVSQVDASFVPYAHSFEQAEAHPMQIIVLILIVSLLGACASTGGKVLGPDVGAISTDHAVIVFSNQVADNTRFQNCSVLAGRSAATAKWIGWNVVESGSNLVALEVPVPEYGFFRFACSYNGVALSTSVEGPLLKLLAGDVIYLGRLVVSDTEFGSAPGHRRMPTAVRLSFEDQSDSDLDILKARLPALEMSGIVVRIPERWNMLAMNRLRPYNRGLRVVQAPTAAAFGHLQ